MSAPSPILEIRPETVADRAAVFRVEERAFGRPDEARIVEAVRGEPSAVSLVACEKGEVVAHVLFSRVTPQAGGGGSTFLALGPVAVEPGRQGLAIGSRLIEAGLDACREAGAAAVFVLGHAAYYPRFGFLPARESGLRFSDREGEPFFALELAPDALEGCAGRVRYPDAFYAV